MIHGSGRDVFCQLEFIANGTLVHYSVPVERKKSHEKPDMRRAIEKEVIRELGYRAPAWKIEGKVVFCKHIEEVMASVREAQAEQVKIIGLRGDGLLDPSPIGGVSEYLTA